MQIKLKTRRHLGPTEYVSQNTYARLIPIIIRSEGGVMLRRDLDQKIQSILASSFSDLDLEMAPVGRWNEMPRWKNICAWAKVSLLNEEQVIQCGRWAILLDNRTPEWAMKLAAKRKWRPVKKGIKKRIKGNAVNLI